MPTYVTLSDLQKRISRISLAQMGSDDGSVNTVAQADTELADATTLGNINACIEDAEEELLGYIRGVVDLTDSGVNGAIRSNVINLAVLKLHQRHRDGQVPDAVLLAADKSLTWARGVANGTMVIQRDPQQAPTKISYNTESSGRVFNTTSLTGWTPGGQT